jgi:acyl-CoA synthetase (AMP-forming)/AMP-acid ligase II
VNEISKVTSTQVQDIREGSFLKGQKLGPESDAVIFFTSGYVSKVAQVLMTVPEEGRKRSSVPSGWRSQISGLGSWVSSRLYLFKDKLMVAPFRAALRAGQPLPPLPKPTDPQRTVLLSIPLFHVTGNLSWLMRAIHGGSKMVYMRHWNVKEAVKLILNENVSVIGG